MFVYLILLFFFLPSSISKRTPLLLVLSNFFCLLFVLFLLKIRKTVSVSLPLQELIYFKYFLSLCPFLSLLPSPLPFSLSLPPFSPSLFPLPCPFLSLSSTFLFFPLSFTLPCPFLSLPPFSASLFPLSCPFLSLFRVGDGLGSLLPSSSNEAGEGRSRRS